jgi:hypothetical protein
MKEMQIFDDFTCTQLMNKVISLFFFSLFGTVNREYSSLSCRPPSNYQNEWNEQRAKPETLNKQSGSCMPIDLSERSTTAERTLTGANRPLH